MLAIAEVGVLGGASRYYTVGVGGWQRSTTINDVDGQPRNANAGVYALGETDLWRGADGRGLAVLTQLGFARGDRNRLSSYVGGGINWSGPFAQRSADIAGLAVAHARNSDQFRRLHATLERAETTLEASYLITPKPWLSLQPDLQYVIDPSTDSSIDNALILGMRVQVTL